MSKIFIAGYGLQGKALAYAFDKLGHKVAVFDRDSGRYDGKYDEWDNQKEYDWAEMVVGYDLVFSALPYFCNFELAKASIDNGIRYVDLGGHVETSKNINDYAKEHAKMPVLTDVGLAPGLCNILAEHVYKQISQIDSVYTINMYCGGIPARPTVDDLLSYSATWSIDGLFNEYLDDCEILKDGEIKTVAGMSDLSTSGKNYELFRTSGGSAHTLELMQKRGVQNCEYKTLRWAGHHKIFNYLYTKLGKDIVKFFKSYNEDVVLFGAYGYAKAHTSIVYDYVITAKDGFSAMQRGTAFSAAAAAVQLLNNKDWWPESLNYSYIKWDDFKQTMLELGIEL